MRKESSTTHISFSAQTMGNNDDEKGTAYLLLIFMHYWLHRFHLGQHRAFAGKETNLEEDISVPFIVRGPGIRQGHVSHVVSSHTDLASTFLALANQDELIPEWLDGGVIPLTPALENHPKQAPKESFAVEFWGNLYLSEFVPLPEGAIHEANTYKTLRLISPQYNCKYSRAYGIERSRGNNLIHLVKYAVWCTGEHELYDLNVDPFEMNNLFDSQQQQTNVTMIRLTNRLNALLYVLKSCCGPTCRDPWSALHGENTPVKSLADALHPKYDAFYKQYIRVGFNECLGYYSTANEEMKQASYDMNALNAASNHDICPIRPNDGSKSSLTKRDDASLTLESSKNSNPVSADEAYRLFHLIPQPSASVGSKVPTADELDASSQPVPQQLLESQVEWHRYGFYNAYGN
ncbi:hypothetical protein LRAMOSA04120 [Lichtheimia ramosa]|uniref:Uncharacterized protein n=1 Tax=Lichtheimia ramosa TaxID=688394 RepID=A0A077WXI0_9FUNG|nr:hypothetical protein LRAMOSA04120 [Lichtheimia ramosa]